MTALSAFLRKTPGEALREYFDRPEIGLPTEFDWSVPEAELSRPLLGAIEKMSRVQRDRISNDASRASWPPTSKDAVQGDVTTSCTW